MLSVDNKDQIKSERIVVHVHFFTSILLSYQKLVNFYWQKMFEEDGVMHRLILSISFILIYLFNLTTKRRTFWLGLNHGRCTLLCIKSVSFVFQQMAVHSLDKVPVPVPGINAMKVVVIYIYICLVFQAN